jgi:endonuclease-3
MTRWTEDTINQLFARLERFRDGCRVTTLSEVERATRSPFHVLVACVISLRTRDEVTAQAAARLFTAADTAPALAAMEVGDIARAIYPAGFYNTKARQLQRIAEHIVSRHGGCVPADEDSLLALPGVGRKTANLVLGIGHGVPAICVDTHVHRIPNRLGLIRTRTPVESERALMAALPRNMWIPANDLLVTFGQNRCHPVSPRCSGCPLDDLCSRAGVDRHR